MKIIWTFTLLMIPGVVSSGSVTGYSGGEVNITCKYKKENTANAKYLCKGKKPKKVKTEWRCELIKTKKKDEWVHSGGFSLYDDTRAAVFTVTIRNLSEQDSGTYHCGVDKTTKKDSYTEVKLDIITERNEHQTTSSFSSAESPLITSASPVTGSSLIITVSVLLLLIITAILLVIVTLWRRCQSHNTDSSSKRSHTAAANCEADSIITVSHTGCDYEDIKDTQKLPTNPADSSNTVYATAELPKNPCVSSDSVYSTVHKPTGDSQTLVTYSEDLNYAVVNFQKKADCSDRNNQDYCEYVAVNHRTA
ncbi:hypothetical protein Q8A67_005287 [Cirrhinus molitorella]|uniref:Ig-like domain-containing protein n=1 Tax=Cirrhinus molitorella TaxID=172907 RepID=A0AA88TTV7_9TELE|nr:hypothetical protein Q8A67_005287 [Cirrhinus molitorella]